MNGTGTYRPRVSRETRLLLMTACIAVAALWVLARIRFADQPVAPNPVQPLLTQIAPATRLDDLASEIGQLQTRIEPFLLRLPAPAFRIRDDLAITLLADEQRGILGDVVARDAATGLTVVRVPASVSSQPVTWSPARFQQPRYLFATEITGSGTWLRPVFMGALEESATPLWPSPIWLVPPRTELTPGSFLLTSDARLAGAVISLEGRPAIVPSDALIAEAERLITRPGGAPAYLGIETDTLTSAVARATGSTTGVVVTWVDPAGPAAAAIEVGDVIEAAAGEPLQTAEHWTARAARLSAGDPLPLQLRRRGETSLIEIVASNAPPPARGRGLGLTLRSVAGIGSEIVRVDRGSMASVAGLVTGDVITRIGGTGSPSPAQVRRVVTAAESGSAILVALTRNDEHRVVALEKP